MPLLAGAAITNITPPLGCSIAGGMVDRIATDVHDELHVRALVLDDGSTRVAIALVDSCAVAGPVIASARHLINSHTAIPMTHILVAATHTHSAPPAAHLFQSVPNPEYQQWLGVRIADAVRLAVNRLKPARIGWGTGTEPRLVFHRRFRMKPGTIPPDPFGRTTDSVLMNPGAGNANVVEPAGPVDPEVGVLALESTDNRPIAVLASYALHYVGGEGPGHITADYFGAWARAMNRMAGAPVVAILANACSGNINNVDVRATPAKREPYVQMNRVADILAAESFRVWRSMSFSDSARLAVSEEELELGVRLPSKDDLENARQVLRDAPGDGTARERRHIYAREALALASWPARVSTSVQAIRIGDFNIATMPGEAFVELGLEIKRAVPRTMMIELANDYRGYIPTVEGHRTGGYETWRAKSSYLETDAAPKLVASAIRQLGRLGA
jgi:hypothetical protein